MKHAHTALSFMCGCLATLSLWWLSADIRAANTPYDPGTVIHVCIANDGVLNVTLECASGQRGLFLKKAEAEGGAGQNGGKKTGPAGDAVATDTQKLADLDRRIRDLESAAKRGELGNKVVEPFVVVDGAGRKVFEVADEDATLYNTGGKAVASISTHEYGSSFIARSSSGKLMATLAAAPTNVSVRLEENGVQRIDLGSDFQAGTYRMKVFGSTGQLIAGIGQSTNKGSGGAVMVMDAAGKQKVSMHAGQDGKGVVEIIGPTRPVVTVTEGEAAGGMLTLMDSNGQAMVRAGVTAEGFGVVRAGPEGFKPGLGVLGLPSSYIAGKAK